MKLFAIAIALVIAAFFASGWLMDMLPLFFNEEFTWIP